MGDAVLNDYLYPTTEIVHEGSCVFFLLETTSIFINTITG